MLMLDERALNNMLSMIRGDRCEIVLDLTEV